MNSTSMSQPAAIDGFIFSPINKQFATGRSVLFNQYNHFTLVWISRGSGMLFLDMESFAIHPDTLYCVLPGQLYRLQIQGEKLGVEIHFTKDFIRDGVVALPKALIHPNPARQVKHLECQGHLADEISDIFQEIDLEYSNDYPSRSEMLHGLLSLVISHFQQNDFPVNLNRIANNDKSIWIRFMDSVESNFRRQKQVREYAAELAVTPNYLTEVLRRVSGFSPRHHIHQRILLEAKRLAVSSSRPAVEIALDLGFDNPFTFSKFFKTLTGSTFTEFRRRYSIQ